MANPNRELITALRQAANRLHHSAPYAWGNHGQCNCGHVLQSLTSFTAKELVAIASGNVGEWTELAEEYCDNTSLPVGQLIAQLQSAGLTPSDIHHLEYLTDKEVLKLLPGGFRWLKRNKREDVIEYFLAMAEMLEKKRRRNTLQTPVKTSSFTRMFREETAMYAVEEEQLYCAVH